MLIFKSRRMVASTLSRSRSEVAEGGGAGCAATLKKCAWKSQKKLDMAEKMV